MNTTQEFCELVDALHRKAKSFCRSHFKKQFCNCCGACCKHLSITVSMFDMMRLVAEYGPRDFEPFKSRWLKRFEERPQQTFMRCPFLNDDNKCGIYDLRPIGCICWLSAKENCLRGGHSILVMPDDGKKYVHPGLLYTEDKWVDTHPEAYEELIRKSFPIINPDSELNLITLGAHTLKLMDRRLIANLMLDTKNPKEYFHGTGDQVNSNNLIKVYESLFGRAPTDKQLEVDEELTRTGIIAWKEGPEAWLKATGGDVDWEVATGRKHG